MPPPVKELSWKLHTAHLLHLVSCNLVTWPCPVTGKLRDVDGILKFRLCVHLKMLGSLIKEKSGYWGRKVW